MKVGGAATLAGPALDDLTIIEYAEMVSGPMCGKMFEKGLVALKHVVEDGSAKG